MGAKGERHYGYGVRQETRRTEIRKGDKENLTSLELLLHEVRTEVYNTDRRAFPNPELPGRYATYNKMLLFVKRMFRPNMG